MPHVNRPRTPHGTRFAFGQSEHEEEEMQDPGWEPFPPEPAPGPAARPPKPRQKGPRTVKLHDTGLFVAYCQNLLNKRIQQDPLWVDGIFGPKTDARTKLFQWQKHLERDGVIGPATLGALEGGPPPIRKRP